MSQVKNKKRPRKRLVYSCRVLGNRRLIVQQEPRKQEGQMRKKKELGYPKGDIKNAADRGDVPVGRIACMRRKAAKTID